MGSYGDTMNDLDRRIPRQHITPLTQFFYDLFLPRFINFPVWYKNLGITYADIAIILVDDTEQILMDLNADLHPASFIQFCTFLLHDRLYEYAHLRMYYTSNKVPILFTPAAIRVAMRHFSRLFSYKRLYELQGPTRQGDYRTKELRIMERQASPVPSIVHSNNNLCDWPVREPIDIRSYNKYESIIKYISGQHHGSGPIPATDISPDEFKQLRKRQFSIRNDSTLYYNSCTFPIWCPCPTHKYVIPNHLQHPETKITMVRIAKSVKKAETATAVEQDGSAEETPIHHAPRRPVPYLRPRIPQFSTSQFLQSRQAPHPTFVSQPLIPVTVPLAVSIPQQTITNCFEPNGVLQTAGCSQPSCSWSMGSNNQLNSPIINVVDIEPTILNIPKPDIISYIGHSPRSLSQVNNAQQLSERPREEQVGSSNIEQQCNPEETFPLTSTLSGAFACLYPPNA